jgi:hypothetical protein
MTAGEVSPDKGAEGVRRLRKWLDLTTRVTGTWTPLDKAFAPLLAFNWPGGGTFSFDLGGLFRGEHLEGKSFLAESKNYKNESDLPRHWTEFLARCYIAVGERPDSCDQFIWASWSPFQATKWDTHMSPESVVHALVKWRDKVFQDSVSAEDAKGLVDHSKVAEVSRRVWMLTLAEKQEELVLTKDHYGEIVKLIGVKAHS